MSDTQNRRDDGPPEFVRVRYGEGSRVVRRCSCLDCGGHCPEGLYDESTGRCEFCVSGRHLNDERPTDWVVNPRV